MQLLPDPSPGDVFFDIEGDPFLGEHGLEYLFGVVDADGFTPYWATDPAEEKQAFERLMDHLMAAWERDPGMHVYHYAPYEPTKLKALSGRYATRAEELDRLLRGQRLVDLYAVVRQGIRVSKESYSIKQLEDFYWGHTRSSDTAGVADGLSTVVEYERWLSGRDDGTPDQAMPRRHPALQRGGRALDARATRVARGAAGRARGRGGGAGPACARAGQGDRRRGAGRDRARRAPRRRGHDLLAGLVELAPPRDATRVVGLTSATRTSRRQSSSRTAPPSATSGCRRSEASVKQSRIWRYPFPLAGLQGLARRVRARRRHPRPGRQGRRPRRRRGVGRAVDAQVGRPAASARTRRPGAGHGPGPAREHRPHRRARPGGWEQPRDPTPRAGRRAGLRPHRATGREAEGRRRPGRTRSRRGRCSRSRALPGRARRMPGRPS